jgi:hypothetical protein
VVKEKEADETIDTEGTNEGGADEGGNKNKETEDTMTSFSTRDTDLRCSGGYRVLYL